MDWENARYLLVEQQIRPWNVLNPVILERILNTRREDFVPADKKELAFVDVELPLAHGQLMLAPKVEARFLQEIDLKPTDKLLIAGPGAAYLAALAAGLCAHVVVVDADVEYVALINTQLKAAGIKNARAEVGDALAANGQAPFDAIIATASFAQAPASLLAQLANNGRLLAIIGEEPMMYATLYRQAGAVLEQKQVFDYNLPRMRVTIPAFEF
ncbi:protein-L-isoaspartate O-methyltransferase family protein [Deefgea piscis]|uniref:protein-L-isoaspartate O-methyltransferase family protein n=1 Tax=Deefgea piscis TaxID=2739061 RepID=UPI001C7FE0F6|nr:protein-L-isoaspartate O-methyltransferase [Deefgea piscis]QZA80572.1 protein-L-isoaspartate O-methyltransferase [Deefgea piscis]